MSQGLFGSARFEQARFNMPAYPNPMAQVLQMLMRFGGVSSVTWQKRCKTGVDTSTGLPLFSFETFQVNGHVMFVPGQVQWLQPGVEPADTIIVFCMDGVQYLDRLVWREKVYEVSEQPKEVWIGSTFYLRQVKAERMKHGP